MMLLIFVFVLLICFPIQILTLAGCMATLLLFFHFPKFAFALFGGLLVLRVAWLFATEQLFRPQPPLLGRETGDSARRVRRG